MNFPPSQVTETEMKNNQQRPASRAVLNNGFWTRTDGSPGLSENQAKSAKRSPRGLLKKCIKMPKPQVVVVVYIPHPMPTLVK